ncbi:MAG: hypothetical protein GYA20_06685, partial [Chloroflexi bacterium]|nr:hypothetical protein [Chloroflexota bacterium]
EQERPVESAVGVVATLWGVRGLVVADLFGQNETWSKNGNPHANRPTRYYDPYISRFISADTIIPQPGNPMAWDRYSYTYNNPVKYNDPSGNKVCEFFDKDGNCNQVVFYLVCGFGTNGNCSQNKRVDGYQGVPLAPYAKHAREEGYQVRYFDFNGDSKPGAKVRMSDTMISYLNKHPNDLPMIIGHSAGADAILLTFGNMSSDQKGRIGGVVLLDPTLTAGPDYSDEGSLQGFVIEMLGIGIPVHVADGIGAGSDQDSGINIDKFLDPEGKDVFNQFSDIYTYKPYPGMNHLILATDLTVFENSLSVLK